MHVRQDFLRKCWLVPHTDAIKWLQKTFPFEAWNLQYPFIAVVWKRTTNAAFIKSPFVLYIRRKVKQVLNDMRGSKCNCMCADWTWDEKWRGAEAICPALLFRIHPPPPTSSRVFLTPWFLMSCSEHISPLPYAELSQKLLLNLTKG